MRYTLILLLTLIALLPGLSVPSWAQIDAVKETQISKGYALVIVAVETEPGTARVGIGYSYPVDHQQVEKQILQLGEKSGWSIFDLKVTTEAAPGVGQQTSASFICAGIINHAQQILGVQPLVETFGSEGNARIVFVVADTRKIWQPQNFVVNNVQVNMSSHGNVYEYEVTNPQAQPSDGRVHSLSDNIENAPDWLKLIALITLICILTAGFFVVGWLLYGRKKRKKSF